MALRIKFATIFSFIATLLILILRCLLHVFTADAKDAKWSTLLPAEIMLIISFFIVLAVINFLFAGPMLKPLLNIINQVGTVAKGNLDQENNKDEFGILELGVTEIADTIRKQHTEIRHINLELSQKNEDMGLLFTATVAALAKAVNARDPYTALHSENVKRYASAVSKKLQLNSEQIYNIEIGALLHDIGKIGVPESVLMKAGKLTDVEFETIKKHPEFGYHIINEIAELRNRGVDHIVLYHHERVDGKGYPRGLKGDAIPINAKIISVCDAFDAMTTSRSYRPALDLDTAIAQLVNSSGTQFDEHIVEVLIECIYENPGLVENTIHRDKNRLASF